MFFEKKYIKPVNMHNKQVGIISPSIPNAEFIPDKIHKGMVNLEKMGFKVKEGAYIYEEPPDTEVGYKRRADMINSLFEDKSVNGLICKSGGEGAINILKHLKASAIKDNPKLVCGYSDNTSLLMYLNDRFKMVVLHGTTLVPGMSEMTDMSRDYFTKLFSRENYPIEIWLNSVEVWNRGKTTGKIVGGNLTRLVEYLEKFPDTNFDNKILFLEETYEDSLSIRSKFAFLQEKRVFEGLKGVLFGNFKGASREEIEEERKFLLKMLGVDTVPILYGFMSGHGEQKIVLPFGTDVTVDANNKRIIYKEYPFCD